MSNISPADPPYLQHIKSGSDLVTPYPAIRAGFVAMALEKNRRATPFVAQARAFKVAAAAVATPDQLVKLADIRLAVLTAAGISDKALFIAAAIEKRMAEEIWQQLNDGTMTNAANLTDDNQVASLSRWLCDL